MSTKNRKLYYYAVGCILLAILCLVGGIGAIRQYQILNSCHDNQKPLRRLEITIEVNQQKELVRQFNNFADKNGFKSHIIYYTPNGEDFLIQLTRKDTEVVATNSFALGEFRAWFYNNDCIHPTLASSMDSLVNDLKNFVIEIPNATVKELP